MVPADLKDVLQSAKGAEGIIWTLASDDIGVKLQLLHFTEGHGVDDHPNDVSDVYWVGLAGAGVIGVDGHEVKVKAGQVLLLPRGASRSVRAGSPELTYLIMRK